MTGVCGAGGVIVPPVRMLISLRFMARHMIWVSRRPEAPTMPPTATRNTSPMAMPAMEPATPDSELSSEMVMGMSAPPTRRENQRPKREAHTNAPTRHTVRPMPWTKAPATTKASVSARNSRVHRAWAFQTTGFCGSTRCSLPAATRLPTSVTMPTATARSAVNRTKAVSPWTDRRPTRADAPPPRPLNRATVCGIWIIWTRTASRLPTSAPMRMDT